MTWKAKQRAQAWNQLTRIQPIVTAALAGPDRAAIDPAQVLDAIADITIEALIHTGRGTTKGGA